MPFGMIFEVKSFKCKYLDRCKNELIFYNQAFIYILSPSHLLDQKEIANL